MDKVEHRRRAEHRLTDVLGLVKPSWEKIVSRTYEDSHGRPLAVDTARRETQEVVDELLEHIRPRISRRRWLSRP